MHILVYEPQLTGHHAVYLKHILQAARQVADSITLITSTHCHELPEYKLHLEGQIYNVNVLAVEDTAHLSGLKQDIFRYQLLRTHIAELRPDAVWIPFVDRLAQVAGLMRCINKPLLPRDLPIPVVGLIFRGAYAYNLNTRLGTIKDRISLKLATMAPLHALYTPDNLLYKFLENQGCVHARLMPEPVQVPILPEGLNLCAELQLPVDPTARFIVSLGGQNRRKGVDLLIKAFLKSKPGPEDYVVLAGKLDADIVAVIEENRNHPLFQQLIVHDELLTDEHLEYYLAVADFIAVPYPEHIGSSSFVIRAAASIKPLIAANTGWIGHTTEQYNLGFTCNVSDISQLSDLLSQVFSNEKRVEQLDSDFNTLVQFHTVENFKNTWLESLQ